MEQLGEEARITATTHDIWMELSERGVNKGLSQTGALFIGKENVSTSPIIVHVQCYMLWQFLYLLPVLAEVCVNRESMCSRHNPFFPPNAQSKKYCLFS